MYFKTQFIPVMRSWISSIVQSSVSYADLLLKKQFLFFN